MMKRLHSCESATGSHRAHHATRYLWIKLLRDHEMVGGWRQLQPPRYTRYLLFCSFGDAFINQTPSASFVLGIFQAPRQHTTCRDWRPYAVGTPLFFFFISFHFWPFFCLVICSRSEHRAWTLQDGLANPKATRFRQSHSTSFHEIRFFERNLFCYDAKLKYSVLQGTFFNIGFVFERCYTSRRHR